MENKEKLQKLKKAIAMIGALAVSSTSEIALAEQIPTAIEQVEEDAKYAPWFEYDENCEFVDDIY